MKLWGSGGGGGGWGWGMFADLASPDWISRLTVGREGSGAAGSNTSLFRDNMTLPTTRRVGGVGWEVCVWCLCACVCCV